MPNPAVESLTKIRSKVDIFRWTVVLHKFYWKLCSLTTRTREKVMFRFLLRNGVNYNEVDNTGRDTLIWACYLGRETQAKDLLEYCLGDIDLCKRDKYGSTGLHYATQHGLKDVVEKLCKAMVKFNLSVDITNKDGNTPYLVAKILHRFEIMTILVNIGNASRCQVNIMYIDASYDNAKYQNTFGCEATECRVTVQEQIKGKQVSCRGTNKGNLTDRSEIYKCRVSKSKTISYTNVQAVTNFGKWWCCCEIRNHKRC